MFNHRGIICPDFIEAGLLYLASEIQRVEENIHQQEYEPPIYNNGGFYETDVFKMRAYYWGEDKALDLPNFEVEDFKINWYKNMGRGMTMNRSIDANEFFNLIDKCLASVREKE